MISGLENSFLFTFIVDLVLCCASLIAQLVKNPPAMQETPVRFLDWEDLLEKEMTAHFRILAWRIPMARGAWWGPWGYKG